MNEWYRYMPPWWFEEMKRQMRKFTKTYRVHLREQHSIHDINGRAYPGERTPENFCEQRIKKVLSMNRSLIMAAADDHRMVYLNNKSDIEKEYWFDSENQLWKIQISFNIPLSQFENGEKITYE